jgi:histone H3/H4
MASRPEIKATITKKPDTDDVLPEAPNQRAPREAGPYRLQVDRQTKASYLTQEAAEAAGLAIKKGHPIVQVSIYNSDAGVNKIIELPPA